MAFDFARQYNRKPQESLFGYPTVCRSRPGSLPTVIREDPTPT